MRPDARILLADVDRAAADIAPFTEGTDLEPYVADTMTQDAVEHRFEIVGEALNRLRRLSHKIGFRLTYRRETSVSLKTLSNHRNNHHDVDIGRNRGYAVYILSS